MHLTLKVILFLLQPPFVPKVMFEGDTSNFDDYPESDWKSSRALEESEQCLFDDFWRHYKIIDLLIEMFFPELLIEHIYYCEVFYNTF